MKSTKKNAIVKKNLNGLLLDDGNTRDKPCDLVMDLLNWKSDVCTLYFICILSFSAWYETTAYKT